jgi:hypothetical protein
VPVEHEHARLVWPQLVWPGCGGNAAASLDVVRRLGVTPTAWYGTAGLPSPMFHAGCPIAGAPVSRFVPTRVVC